MTTRIFANLCVKSEDRCLLIHAGNLPGPAWTRYDLLGTDVRERPQYAY